MKKVMKRTLFVVLALCLAFICVGTLNAKAAEITKDSLVTYHNEKIKPLIEAVDNTEAQYVSYTMKAEYDDMMAAYDALVAADKAYVDEKTDNFKWVVELGNRLDAVEAAVKAAVNAIKGYGLVAEQPYLTLEANIKLATKDLAAIYKYIDRLDETQRAAINDIKGDSADYDFENAWKDYIDACAHYETAKALIEAYEKEVTDLYDALYDEEAKKLDNFYANKTDIEKLDSDYDVLDDAASAEPTLVTDLCEGVKQAVLDKKEALEEGLKTTKELMDAVGTKEDALSQAIQLNITNYPANGTKADGIYAENVKTALEELKTAIAALKEHDTSAYNEQTDIAPARTLADQTDAAYKAQQKEVDDVVNYFVNDLDINKIVGTYPAAKATYDALCPNQKAAFNKVTYEKTVGEDGDLPTYKDCSVTEVNNLGEYKAYLDGLFDYAQKTAIAYENEITKLNYRFTYAYYQTLLELKGRLDKEPLYVTNAITSKAFVDEDLAKIDAEVKKADAWMAAVDYNYAADYTFKYDDIAEIAPSYTAFNALSEACQQFLADNADAKEADKYNAQYLAYAKYAHGAEAYEKMVEVEAAAEAAIAKLVDNGSLLVPTDLRQFVEDFYAVKATVDAFKEGETDKNHYKYNLSDVVEDKLANYAIYKQAEEVVPGYEWCIDVDDLYEDEAAALTGDAQITKLGEDCDLVWSDIDAIAALEAEKATLGDKALAVVSDYYSNKLAVGRFVAEKDAIDNYSDYALRVANLIGSYGYKELVDEFDGTLDVKAAVDAIVAKLEEIVAAKGVTTVDELLGAIEETTDDAALIAAVKGNKVSYVNNLLKALVAANVTDLDKLEDEINEEAVLAILTHEEFMGLMEIVNPTFAEARPAIVADYKAFLASDSLVPGSEIKSDAYDYTTLPFITIVIAQVKAYEDLAIAKHNNGQADEYFEAAKAKYQEIKDFCNYLADKLNADIENIINAYDNGGILNLTLEELKNRFVTPATKIENVLTKLHGSETERDTQRWYVLRVAKFREIEDLISWKYFYAVAASSLAKEAKDGYFTVEGYTELYDLKALYRQADPKYQNLVTEYFEELHNEITPLYEEKLAADELQSYETLRKELKKEIADAKQELLDCCAECKEQLEAKIEGLDQRLVEAEQAYANLSSALAAEKAAREAAELQATNVITTIAQNVAANKAAINTEASTREAADAAEKSAREAADATEKAAREAADATEKAAREAADAAEVEARKAAVIAEENARKAADDAEKAAREAADANIIADVQAADAAEKSAREAADAAEKAAREAAVTAEEEARKTADENEKAAREAADAELQNNIDELGEKVKTITIILAIVSGLAFVGVIVLFIIKK